MPDSLHPKAAGIPALPIKSFTHPATKPDHRSPTLGVAPWDANPRGLVSVWDMLKINGGAFVEIAHVLGLAEAASGISDQMKILRIETTAAGQQINIPNEKQKIDLLSPRVFDWLKEVEHDCETLALNISAKQAQRIIATCEQNPALSLQEFGRMAAELTKRLEDELSGVLLLHVDKNVALYGAPFPFGEKVAERFASANEDVQEAACCLGTLDSLRISLDAGRGNWRTKTR